MDNLYQALQAVDFYRKVTIRDMLCVEYKCMDRRDYFDFWTDCGCLVYCTAGKKLYRSSTEDFEVSPGMIFFMKKGAYTGQNYLEETYCALMFFMPESFFRDFLFRFPHLKLGNRQIESLWQDGIILLENEPVLTGYFNSVIAYFKSAAQISKDLLGIKLDELVLNLFTQPAHKHFAAYLSNIGSDRDVNFKYLIEENYASNLKLEEYARLASMSLSTFKRVFRKNFGISPGKWLLSRKLHLAQKLLKQSGKNINEISFQCGFESSSHFIRVFKKEFGKTPHKFRTLND